MKKYRYGTLYRGQQIDIEVCAKNNRDAAEKLGISTYYISKYCYVNKIETPFEGVLASFNSGMLWEKERHLIGVKMPYDELKAIIDGHKDKQYAAFEKEIGI